MKILEYIDSLTDIYGIADFNKNKKELLQREGKLIQSAFVKWDPMELDTEFCWHNDVNDVIEKIISG